MTSIELRAKLDEIGYDVDAIDGVSRDLGLDVMALLAAWAPAILRAAGRRPSLWQRFLAWRKPR
jgi:hypothetical protein